MRILISILLSVYTLGGFAQIRKDTHDPKRVYKLAMKARKQLITSGVKTTMLYEQGAVGFKSEESGSCQCSKSTGHIQSYLIWKQDNKQFLRKFDCCHIYQPVEIKPDLFTTFLKHKEVIEHEKIQSQVFVIYYNFRHIHLYHQGVQYNFQLHDFDFNEKNRPYYNKNLLLKVKLWCDEITEAIRRIELDTTFTTEQDISN